MGFATIEAHAGPAFWRVPTRAASVSTHIPRVCAHLFCMKVCEMFPPPPPGVVSFARPSPQPRLSRVKGQAGRRRVGRAGAREREANGHRDTATLRAAHIQSESEGALQAASICWRWTAQNSNATIGNEKRCRFPNHKNLESKADSEAYFFAQDAFSSPPADAYACVFQSRRTSLLVACFGGGGGW